MKRTQETAQKAVAAPRWVQKKIIRNLKQAAKSRVSFARAKRAQAILRMLIIADTRACHKAQQEKTSALGATDSTAHLAPNGEGVRKSIFAIIADKAKTATSGLLHIAKAIARWALWWKPGRRSELVGS